MPLSVAMSFFYLLFNTVGLVFTLWYSILGPFHPPPLNSHTPLHTHTRTHTPWLLFVYYLYINSMAMQNITMALTSERYKKICSEKCHPPAPVHAVSIPPFLPVSPPTPCR